MKTLFYLHWNEAELKDRLSVLENLSLKVVSHWDSQARANWGAELPDIFVISLDRLPSHGKAYAQWLRESKNRQHIPLIFVDGKPAKVEQIRKAFPMAIFCSSSNLVRTLEPL